MHVFRQARRSRPILRRLTVAAAAAGLLLAGRIRPCSAEEKLPSAAFFEIQVLDEVTARPVPMVELRSVDGVRWMTDSAGRVAYHAPGQMDQEVFFYVESHGYQFPPDGFGFAGTVLRTKPGTRAEIKLHRLNLAERLYRVTGAGIYHDTLLLGHPAPLAHPLLNAQVTGSDSVQMTRYDNRLYWFWGDTNRPRYPLGNFHVPGATSPLPDHGGLPPEVGVDLTYFVGDDGFARPTCQMAGDGPTWIDGLVVLPDVNGQEQMLCAYVKVRSGLDVYRRGLARFDRQQQAFVHLADVPLDAPLMPHGHARVLDRDGSRYVYFGNPLLTVRAPATAEGFADLEKYEGYTCLTPGTRFQHDRPRTLRLETAAPGQPAWGWKRGTAPLAAREQQQLVRAGRLPAAAWQSALVDVETGNNVVAHAGSMAWNAYRECFVVIAEQSEGSSYLGEVWYAEADRPEGPYGYARKIVTHNNYSFYNPRHHVEFDAQGGRLILFEGTYSTFFAPHAVATPRYDYNQIMYRLDLADPRLALPRALLRTSDAAGLESYGWALGEEAWPARAPFCLLPLAGAGTAPLAWIEQEGQRQLACSPRQVPAPSGEQILGYALPLEIDNAPATTTLLFDWTNSVGQHVYRTAEEPAPRGYQRQSQPLCRVWRPALAAP